MKIIEDSLTDPLVIDLLQYHVTNMQDGSPLGTSFVLDLESLRAPEITVWSLWIDEQVAGCVAMKEITPKWGEIKSMRSHPNFVGKGVGRALLDHILNVAQNRGYTKLSLETGTGSSFFPAIELYARNGFEIGDVFGDYLESSFNIYMHRDI